MQELACDLRYNADFYGDECTYLINHIQQYSETCMQVVALSKLALNLVIYYFYQLINCQLL